MGWQGLKHCKALLLQSFGSVFHSVQCVDVNNSVQSIPFAKWGPLLLLQVQNKSPKVDAKTMEPVSWPKDPDMEWWV